MCSAYGSQYISSSKISPPKLIWSRCLQDEYIDTALCEGYVTRGFSSILFSVCEIITMWFIYYFMLTITDLEIIFFYEMLHIFSSCLMLAGNLTWKPQILEILSQEFRKTDFFFCFFLLPNFLYIWFQMQ